MPPFPAATTASATTHLALLVVLSSSSLFFLYKSITHRRLRRSSSPSSPSPSTTTAATPTLLYASATGTSKALAARLSRRIADDAGVPAVPTDAAAFDPDDLPSVQLLLLVLPTHDAGAPPPDAAFLARWLAETVADFRAGALLLSSLRFAVFGVGSRAYGETFNAAARSFSRWLRALGAVEVVPVGEGDVDGGDIEEVFDQWCGRVLRVVKGEEEDEDGVNGETNGFDELEGEESDYDDEDDEEEEVVANGEVDMEDIAGKAIAKKQNGKVDGGLPNGAQNGARAMVTPIIRASLEKQVSIKFSLHFVLHDALDCICESTSTYNFE
jgi:tRNA wybutosine-synthesizing protein 1